jgi:RND family efflux transporter MFP subunit
VFSGTVKYIGGEVRPATRDIIVEAVVQNTDGALLPGMFVDANLRTGDNSRPVVPVSAVFASGSEKSVYVAKSGHLEQRIVRIGVRAGEFVAVEEGVKAGEFVVTNPPSANSDGAPIL